MFILVVYLPTDIPGTRYLNQIQYLENGANDATSTE